MKINLFLRKVYWHLIKTMPCEMILKTKWNEYRKIESHYWSNNFDFSSMNVGNTNVISNVISNKNIFVYWNKGFSNAPLIVQKCYEQLQKYKPDGWTVITLTDNNIEEYIHMPVFLKEMLRNDQIYIANYSDILRSALLYFYGGIWIDATCFLTKPIPQYILNDELFMFSIENRILPYTPMKFENWFIRANKHNYVIGRILENMLYYFKNCKSTKSIYFIYFYIISSLYNHDSKAKKLMNEICYMMLY